MDYRTVYTESKVLTSIVNDDNTVTSSNERFIIDTVESTIMRLFAWGVNVSYFWKNGLADRFQPNEFTPEISISDHPSEVAISRKAFIHGMSIDQLKKEFRLNIVIRHFDDEGNHVPGIVDDEVYSSLASNAKLVDDGSGNEIGEFDFFVGLINQGANMFQLQQAYIPIIDGNGRFDNIYS